MMLCLLFQKMMCVGMWKCVGCFWYKTWAISWESQWNLNVCNVILLVSLCGGWKNFPKWVGYYIFHLQHRMKGHSHPESDLHQTCSNVVERFTSLPRICSYYDFWNLGLLRDLLLSLIGDCYHIFWAISF